jgi:hypothetical protein
MGLTRPSARRILLHETEALLQRLDRVRPLVTQIPSVPAAAIAPAAASAIDRFLDTGRDELRELVHGYRAWLEAAGNSVDPAEAQRRFVMVRLRFNRVLAHFETFSDVLVQRCEHDAGTLLHGLDVLAADALSLGAPYLEPSQVITHLDRGVGAAIRKARTRLPGGGENPVAIIRVPRERMVGSGVGASLVHEVGHQVAASLDLVGSLRAALRTWRATSGSDAPLWAVWDRWISEIIADFWAVGVLGIGGTLGLIQVVSLPRPFVFKVHLDDPHPVPWLRVHVSCALGSALYPDPQWEQLGALWDGLYPLAAAGPTSRVDLIRKLHAHLPSLVAVLLDHRPASCHGRRLRELVPWAERTPERLRALHEQWSHRRGALRNAMPSLAMAVLGQAKFDGRLAPHAESEIHTRLLRAWAIRGTLGISPGPPQQAAAPLRQAA